MADVEIKQKKGHSASSKTNKKLIRVDLTPMVDLGFLLITFFVFTTTMARPTVMDIRTPYDTKADDDVCNSCALTVLLGGNNSLYYYAGAFENAVLKTTDYRSVRDVIQQQKQQLRSIGREVSQFSLIIKATDSASFRNFVDITDEVTINAVSRYYIGDITAEEKAKMSGR